MKPFHLFDLFGFEVRLDLSWLLLGLLISWSLGAGYFPVEYPGLATTTYAWMGISVAIGVLFSIVLHEFAHSWVARRFGIPIRGITLFIFGGVAEMQREPPSPKSELLMAIAGPIASFALAAFFLSLEQITLAAGWPASILGVNDALASINLIVAIFNLVPAFPLDGGRVLRAVLWWRRQDLKEATFVSSQFGKGFGIALMILGVISFLTGNVVGGMWWFLIGIFVRGAATSSYQQVLIQEVIEDKPVSHFMRRHPITVSPSTTIAKFLEDYVYQHHFKMFPVVEGSELVGCILLADVKQVPHTESASRTVRELMRPVTSENSVPADMPTSKLLTGIMQPSTQSRYMVVDNGQLVGMISIKDLLEVIALRIEFDET